jgi:hypothetical protein
MYFNYSEGFPNPVEDLTASGVYSWSNGMTVWTEDFNNNWRVAISISGLPNNVSRYLTLHSDIQDVYVVGEHRIDSLQQQDRIINLVPTSLIKTNVSKWSRDTYSGIIVGEIDTDLPVDYPFDLTFSGTMRHFSAHDGFWFGSMCMRFNADRGPYVAFADYPAEGEDSWIELSWIQQPLDMLFVEKYDFGRVLIPTMSGNIYILDTEDTFDPYTESDLSNFIASSGIIITGLDTQRIY